MNSAMQFVNGTLESLFKGVTYSIEHMTVTQWGILGTASVIVGFLLLRTTRI